ncbi:PIG-L deacetylase family protein [Algoriphagus sediminis]|uniref:PIG-L deacetylase family protein n=1 Tax=Algoriphagus sediminis TaxID=3057113 RepID=A0ABT7YDD5_9BACT|nr:PIG-L deacetylase family protein [Algoriphagus sediminis]MDN3204493.1 PIG-L deacetylase family protein [Algoriphagus sediminis]
MKKGLKILGLILGIFILISPFLLIQFGKNALNDNGVPLIPELSPANTKQRIMAFFPHPDDEVTVSGTLIDLKRKGHEVFLVTLTKGEAGSSPENYPPDKLKEIRTQEMKNSAQILEVDSLFLLDYEDGGLSLLGQDSLEALTLSWIKDLNPDIILSYDSKVGLYGHEDHRLTGLAVENVFLSHIGDPGFSPKALYQVTLSNKQIKLALELSEGFRNNYPKEKDSGLPKPDFAVNIQPYFDTKLEVMKAHHSQRHVLSDLMPWHDQIPVWIYSRIFDREYYHEVKK